MLRNLFQTLAFIPALLLGGCSAHVTDQAGTDYEMAYTVSFEPETHYIDVALELRSAAHFPDSILLRMPVWAPGYYTIVDFPKYLVDFAASDSAGRSLGWTKQEKDGWKVEAADTMRISYRVYANERSVVNSRVEEDMAFVAPNGVFMHMDGDIQHPADVRFVLPEGWTRISTALPVKDSASFAYLSPDFDVLYDSPLLIGNHYSKTISHDGHDYEFALETPQGFEESPIAEDFLKAVDEAVEMFGGKTAYEDYHLLLLGQGGGGLEHQASQADYTAGRWDFGTRGGYLSMLRFLVHEFFHNYNVKAIRPIALGPFDYSREVYTPMLWVSEGFTNFYESALLVRAGIETEEEHLAFLSDYIRTVETAEGHRHMSLRRSSYDIWLNFFNMSPNSRDTRISYYDKGPVMALLFDCTIRSMTGGERSLDDLMRLLYDRYYEAAGRGWTESEFWKSAEEVAGGSLETLRRYVDTTDEIDYDSILNPAGLQLDATSWSLSRL